MMSGPIGGEKEGRERRRGRDERSSGGGGEQGGKCRKHYEEYKNGREKEVEKETKEKEEEETEKKEKEEEEEEICYKEGGSGEQGETEGWSRGEAEEIKKVA